MAVNKANAFGAKARTLLYPISNSQVFDACENKAYLVGAAASKPSWMGQGVRGASGAIVWSSRVCPPDLLSSKPQTIIVQLRGDSDTWTTTHIRLFDTSSGSGWRLFSQRQTSTSLTIAAASFSDTGFPITEVTVPNRQPVTLGIVYLGSNNVRLYVNGRMVGTDTVTVDADASGTDTRLEFGGSTSTDIDYFFGAWFAGALTDGEMANVMANPWQCLMPEARHRPSAAAVGGTFNVAWAIAANSVIPTGAIAA